MKISFFYIIKKIQFENVINDQLTKTIPFFCINNNIHMGIIIYKLKIKSGHKKTQ